MKNLVAIVVCVAVLASISPASAATCPASIGDAIQGKSIREAYTALKSVPQVKGEFEPTELFNERRQAALAALPSVIPISKPLVHEFGEVYVRYDADGQVFEILPGAFSDPPHICCSSLPVERAVRSTPEAQALSGISDQEILIEFQTKTIGQYEATNAFGVSATVTQSREDFWGIYSGDENKWRTTLPEEWYKWFGKPLFRIATPLGEAPSVKKQLRGVIYVSPKAPYTIEGEYLSEPTIQNKSERRLIAHYIVGSIDCFAVLDQAGKIVAQQNF